MNNTKAPGKRQQRPNGSRKRKPAAPVQNRNRLRSSTKQRGRARSARSPFRLLPSLLLVLVLLFAIGRVMFGGRDTESPVITLEYKSDYTVLPGAEYEEEGFSATDNRDGDLTDRVERTVMEDKICYKVSDRAGNITVRYRDIPFEFGKGDSSEDFPDIKCSDPNAKGKVVYLTFDDGPGPYTEQLLDTLDRYGAKVTFFVTGAKPAYENMIQKEDAAGHSVGIHTLTHDFEKIYSSDKAFWKDISQMQEIVERQTGHKTNLMRFAGGSSNSISANYTPGIMTLLTEQAPQKGFQYFDWNISSGDGGTEGSSRMVIENITSHLADVDPCVILCHDTKEYTVNAMKYLIPWLINNGYSLQPLQFDSMPAHHGVQN